MTGSEEGLKRRGERRGKTEGEMKRGGSNAPQKRKARKASKKESKIAKFKPTARWIVTGDVTIVDHESN